MWESSEGDTWLSNLQLGVLARAAIAGLTYSAGWMFGVIMPGELLPDDTRAEQVYLCAGMITENVQNPGERVILRSCRAIPHNATTEAVVALAFLLVRRQEEHERREWLRLHGVPVFLPHAEDGTSLPVLTDDRMDRGFHVLLPAMQTI